MYHYIFFSLKYDRSKKFLKSDVKELKRLCDDFSNSMDIIYDFLAEKEDVIEELNKAVEETYESGAKAIDRLVKENQKQRQQIHILKHQVDEYLEAKLKENKKLIKQNQTLKHNVDVLIDALADSIENREFDIDEL